MIEFYCSRVAFTLLGAPQESFFIKTLSRVSLQERQQNTPLALLNYRPTPQRYIQSFSKVSLNIIYPITEDSKTFDFRLLPYYLLNGQLTLYKKNDTIAIVDRVAYDGTYLLAEGHNKPTHISVSFLATDMVLNSFI